LRRLAVVSDSLPRDLLRVGVDRLGGHLLQINDP